MTKDKHDDASKHAPDDAAPATPDAAVAAHPAHHTAGVAGDPVSGATLTATLAALADGGSIPDNVKINFGWDSPFQLAS